LAAFYSRLVTARRRVTEFTAQLAQQVGDGKAIYRVGGEIRPPTKLSDARPQYPSEALAAGIQGVVILEVTVNESGNVTNPRILRSIPLLDEAAIEAVRQWQFTPSMLNGQTIPVVMTTTVNFVLPPASAAAPPPPRP
jgi:protein TonB